MLPITQEWVEKAEGDYEAVCTLLRSRKKSRRDIICFHAQQSVEKYLKAILTEDGIAFPKTHDLVALLPLLIPNHASLSGFANDFQTLTSMAVLIRYPGWTAVQTDMTNAVRVCRRFRTAARKLLGLPP